MESEQTGICAIFADSYAGVARLCSVSRGPAGWTGPCALDTSADELLQGGVEVEEGQMAQKSMAVT